MAPSSISSIRISNYSTLIVVCKAEQSHNVPFNHNSDFYGKTEQSESAHITTNLDEIQGSSVISCYEAVLLFP